MNKIEYGTEFLDQLKDSVHDLYDENKELKKEIERLNKENELLKSNPNFVYAMRNNKAIEYIDNLKIDSEQEYYNGKTNMYEDYVKIIKDILKGEHNDN